MATRDETPSNAVQGPVLIIGGDSTIGSTLRDALLSRQITVLGTSRRPIDADEKKTLYPLDLGAEEMWLDHLPQDIQTVVMAAAMTREQDCATNPALAERINVTNTKKVLEHYAEQGCCLVFLSTNLVLDGTTPAATADTPLSPLGVYGHQKAQIEMWLRDSGADYRTCRLGKVLFPDLPLICQWRKALLADKAISAFRDYYLSPVTSAFIASTLARIVIDGTSGTYQLTGSDTISYHDLASMIADGLGVSSPRLTSSSWKDVPSITFSPRFTHLDDARIRAEFSIPAPTPEETIAALFARGFGG